MADQIVDKRSVGIPPDVVLARHQTLGFRDEAEAHARDSAASATDSATYAQHAAAHASNASTSARDAAASATEAAMWAEVASMRTLLRPTEPPAKLDGMVWMRTDEQAGTIVAINRWDADLPGSGLFPSAATYPGGGLYPTERGAWTAFAISAGVIAPAV